MDPGRVLVGRAAAQVGRIAARDSQLDRVDLPLPDAAADHLAHEIRSGRRELVDPAGAVDDECTPGAEMRQHARDRRHELGRVDADDLRAGTGRVRQRPEDVEHRPRGQLTTDRRRMAHGWVMRGREEEAEAEFVDRARDSLRRQLEVEPERLEDVRRA